MGDWYSLQPQGARREGREREGVRVGRKDVGGIGKAASFRRAWWAGLAGLADLTCRCEQEGVGWGSLSLSLCVCPTQGLFPKLDSSRETNRPRLPDQNAKVTFTGHHCRPH